MPPEAVGEHGASVAVQNREHREVLDPSQVETRELLTPVGPLLPRASRAFTHVAEHGPFALEKLGAVLLPKRLLWLHPSLVLDQLALEPRVGPAGAVPTAPQRVFALAAPERS